MSLSCVPLNLSFMRIIYIMLNNVFGHTLTHRQVRAHYRQQPLMTVIMPVHFCSDSGLWIFMLLVHRKQQALARMGNPAWSDNWTLAGLDIYGEIMHPETRSVWLSQQPFTLEEYSALQVPEGFLKSGTGRSSHDLAFFRRSPGGTVDGPLATTKIGDRTFSRVARPGPPEPGFNGVLVLPVYKYHNVMFRAGRTIEIMDCGDGWDYVPQVTEMRGLPGVPPTAERVLPDGWSVREILLQEDLHVEVPCPARVCLFFSGHIFHGPVRLGLN